MTNLTCGEKAYIFNLYNVMTLVLESSEKINNIKDRCEDLQNYSTVLNTKCSNGAEHLQVPDSRDKRVCAICSCKNDHYLGYSSKDIT